MTDLRINNINIASQYSVNNTEAVNTTESQNSVFETAKAEQPKQDNKKDANLTNMIKKWYNYTDEEWETFSTDKKAAIAKTYIEECVIAHNEKTNDKLTVERQYELYLQRNVTPEEREVLTLLALNFGDAKLQYNCAIMSVETAQDEKTRDVAEKTLAGNYYKAAEENQPKFVGYMTQDFNEKNIEIAAQNASKTNVEVQETVVKNFLNTNNEKINKIIESQSDKFGIDNKGKINESVKKACAKEIAAAKAEMKAKKEAAAKKTETKVETTKTATAEKTIVTKKETVTVEKKEVEKEEKTEDKETEETKKVTKSSVEKTEEKIANISKLIKEENKVELKSNIKEMTDQEKITLLEQNPDLEIINIILSNHPSFLVSCKIQKILNKMDVKNISNDIIANANEDTQIKKIQQAASENRLNTIHRFCLTANAKRVYDRIA